MDIVITFTGYIEIRYRSRIVEKQPAHDVRGVDQDHRFFTAEWFENNSGRDTANGLKNERDTRCKKEKQLGHVRDSDGHAYRTKKLESRWMRVCLDCRAPSSLSGLGWQW